MAEDGQRDGAWGISRKGGNKTVWTVPEQGLTDKKRAGQGGTRPDRAKQGRTEPDRAEQGWTGPSRAEQGLTRGTRPNEAEQQTKQNKLHIQSVLKASSWSLWPVSANLPTLKNNRLAKPAWID